MHVDNTTTTQVDTENKRKREDVSEENYWIQVDRKWQSMLNLNFCRLSEARKHKTVREFHLRELSERIQL